MYETQLRIYRTDINARKLEEITPARATGGAVDYNLDRAYKWQCKLDVVNPDALRELRDFVVPEITIARTHGSVTIPVGHFVVAGKDTEMDDAHRTGGIQGWDLTYLLEKTDYPSGITAPAGVDRALWARQLLIDFGLSPQMIDIPASGIVFAEDKPYDPGSTVFAVATDALNGAGMYAPFLREDLKIASMREIDLSRAPADATYSNADPDYLGIVDGSIKETPDYDRLRNRVTVVSLSPNRPPIAASAVVTDRTSPIHADNLGREMGLNRPYWRSRVEHAPTIETVEAAQTHADALISQVVSYYRRLRIETLPAAALGAHKIIGLDVWRGRTQHYGGTWRQNAWVLDLDDPALIVSRDLNRTERWK